AAIQRAAAAPRPGAGHRRRDQRGRACGFLLGLGRRRRTKRWADEPIGQDVAAVAEGCHTARRYSVSTIKLQWRRSSISSFPTRILRTPSPVISAPLADN